MKKEAAKGAEFLDMVKPGWARKIKIKIFYIGCPDNCPIGQLFGYYNSSIFRTHFCDAFIFSHGFHYKKHSDFFELQEAWLQEIRKRKKK